MDPGSKSLGYDVLASVTAIRNNTELTLILPNSGGYSLPTANWLAFPAAGDPEPVYPLSEVLRGIAGSGCGGVGLDERSVGAFHATGATADELAALLTRLVLHCTDVGILRVGDGKATALARSLARLARATRADICVTTLSAPVSPRLLDELRTCAEVLAGADARLALEFASYGHPRTLDEAVAVCEAVGWERCGLLVDTWHFFSSGAPWSLLRSLDCGRIALVHVNDAPAPAGYDVVHESRHRRLPPGAGTFPLAEFVTVMKTVGYDGPISGEVLSARLRRLRPADAAREIMDGLREHWPAVDTRERSRTPPTSPG
jgi:sugar phosphate isomerase/epimerase